MVNIIRDYLRDRKKRTEIARGDNGYLVNAFIDKAFIRDLINEVIRTGVDVTIYSLDGQRMIISKHNNDKPKNNWINSKDF